MTSVIRHAMPVLVGFLCIIVPARATLTQQSFFEEGNQLYLSGDYAGALDRYLRVADEGLGSAPLFYNLGNTYFKLGDIGRSILFYERALRLDPGDADIRANLNLARSYTTDEITPLPTFWLVRAWRWWTHVIPLPWLTVLVGALYVIAVGSLTVSLLSKRGIASASRKSAIAAGALFLVLGINLTVRWFGIGQPEEAVIVSDEVLVQSAPSDDRSLQIFTIHTGTKVRVDQLSGQWAEIVLEDGKVGWVRRDVFEMI